MVTRERSATGQVITTDMLADLPTPVQRYLTFSGVIGRVPTQTVRLKYRGKFRLARDKPWMQLDADQYYTTTPPAFQWNARFRMFGVPFMVGSDTYKDSHGHMFGKLLGLKTIFDARGPEMDMGTMLRYLQEAAWFPTAFLNRDYFTWSAVDDHAADVTFTDGGKSVTARMFFDDQGRYMNFIAQRYMESGGTYRMGTWAAPMIEYGHFSGLNVPVSGYGTWYLPEGDLPYITLRVSEITYDQPIPAI
jgi:hypothetical protein